MQYQIFLSYSHQDADLLGKEYIWELKRQIEDSVGMKDSVFLDVDALNLGVDWNKTINECLDCSKVFICLLSSNYIASEYCRRERLWWENKEMRNGMLSRNTLPIYFIEVPEEKRTQSTAEWILQTNARPWFEQGVPETLQKEVKQRLADAAQRERNVSELLHQKDSEEKTVLETIQTMKERYDLGAESFSSVPCYNLDFVGRIKELSEIRSICIKRHGTQDIPVIYGPAGCGKSDLAFAYANGYAADYPGGRFLINMATCHDWKSALCQMVTSYSGKSKETQVSTSVCEELLGIKTEEFTKLDEEKRYQAVCAALERRCKEKPVLIVLDNVVDQELFHNDSLSQLVEHGIPQNLDIIATTRKRPEGLPMFNINLETSSLAVAYFLGNLEEFSALELFRKHCIYADFNTNPPDGNENKQIQEETQAAREIVRLLDYHAWSINHIAGAFSKCYKRTEPPNIEGEDPVECGDKTCMQLLDELRKLDALGNNEYLKSVDIEDYSEQVMQFTVNIIEQQENGKDILHFAAAIILFAADFVPLRMLEAFWNEVYNKDRSYSWANVKEALQGYHILSGSKAKICRMHRLTRKYFEQYAQNNNIDLGEKAGKLAECINSFTVKESVSNEEAVALLQLGMVWSKTSWAEANYWFLLRINPREGFSHYLFTDLSNYKKMLHETFEPLTEENPLINAALLFFDGDYKYNTGFYEEAANDHFKGINIYRNTIGKEDFNIAESFTVMGECQLSRGAYRDAEWCFKRSLGIIEEIGAKEGYNVAVVHEKLGDACLYQNKLDEAMKNYNESLANGDESCWASVYNGIGNVYFYQGEYAKALEIYEKALEIKQSENSPDIYVVYNNIGACYEKQGKYAKALEKYQESLRQKKNLLGDAHTELASSYENIGRLYTLQKEYDKALEELKKGLKIREERSGCSSPKLAYSYAFVAETYYLKCEYDSAHTYIHKALEIISSSDEDFSPLNPISNLAWKIEKKLRGEES